MKTLHNFLKTETLHLVKIFKNVGVYSADFSFSHDERVQSEVKQIDVFIQTRG